MSKQLWVLDPVHSEITFKVRHMMITTVSGTFNNFTGSLNANEGDFSDAEVSFEAEITSVNTRNEQRDEHLRSNDFFEAATYPTLNFKSKSFTKNGEGSYTMTGDFTMKGVTKAMSFQVDYTGTVIDPWGQVKAGFEITGAIQRADFNLSWNAANESGDLVLSEDVKLAINAQVVKQL
jgi:polyisoprenoid-binding protein YceI